MSARSLSEHIKAQLFQSCYPVAIYSENTINAKWINEEVTHFTSLDRSNRIGIFFAGWYIFNHYQGCDSVKTETEITSKKYTIY